MSQCLNPDCLQVNPAEAHLSKFGRDAKRGWLNWCRRLSKDYEVLPATSETFIYVATIRLLLKRLAA